MNSNWQVSKKWMNSAIFTAVTTFLSKWHSVFAVIFITCYSFLGYIPSAIRNWDLWIWLAQHCCMHMATLSVKFNGVLLLLYSYTPLVWTLIIAYQSATFNLLVVLVNIEYPYWVAKRCSVLVLAIWVQQCSYVLDIILYSVEWIKLRSTKYRYALRVNFTAEDIALNLQLKLVDYLKPAIYLARI